MPLHRLRRHQAGAGAAVRLGCQLLALAEPVIEEKARHLAARCKEPRSSIGNSKGALIDHGQRCRAGKPISTSRAEGAVNQMVSARVNKRRQTRWSPGSAYRVLRSGRLVLDGRFGHPATQLAA